jgi:hypothetical protein
MRRLFVLMSSFAFVAFLIGSTAGAAAQQAASTNAPETFNATANVKGETASLTATVDAHIRRYTPNFDRTSVESGLKHGGYSGFVAALRKAPVVGHVTLAKRETPIRYAREQTTEKGRTITLVTDKPVFFIGGGAGDPKSRAGFEVAVLVLNVDATGTGDGLLVAAARVKPGPDEGTVVVDDYAEAPITLTNVRRSKSEKP